MLIGSFCSFFLSFEYHLLLCIIIKELLHFWYRMIIDVGSFLLRVYCTCQLLATLILIPLLVTHFENWRRSYWNFDDQSWLFLLCVRIVSSTKVRILFLIRDGAAIYIENRIGPSILSVPLPIDIYLCLPNISRASMKNILSTR